MVSQVAASQVANRGLFTSSTCSKVAGFISRNRWLLLGAALLSGALIGGYVLYRYSVTPTVNNIPKRLVAKPFKWGDLHPGTQISAVMSRWDDVKKNIDKADLAKVAKEEFKPCEDTRSGKNTTTLTLLLMLEPEKLSEHLKGEYHSDYLVMALADYLRYDKEALQNVINLLKSSSKQNLLIQALISSEKCIDAYRADNDVKDVIIKAIDHNGFAALYQGLDDAAKKEATQRLIEHFLDNELKLNFKELMQKELAKEVLPYLWQSLKDILPGLTLAELNTIIPRLKASIPPSEHAKLTDCIPLNLQANSSTLSQFYSYTPARILSDIWYKIFGSN